VRSSRRQLTPGLADSGTTDRRSGPSVNSLNLTQKGIEKYAAGKATIRSRNSLQSGSGLAISEIKNKTDALGEEAANGVCEPHE
jgi:hypothetical protein